jgi:hypothetical protein
LLEKVMASKPDMRNDLRHALAISQIYGSLAALYRRSGQRDRGKALSALRVELWHHWDRKLPNNSFVRRQLEAARTQGSLQIPASLLASQKEKDATAKHPQI